MKKIICLHAGPGAGKSTTCAGLFYNLKLRGYNCEMNREYVKDWVWEGRQILPGDQSYLFAKQARAERILMQQGLDFIITDSPLILNKYYGDLYDPIEQNHPHCLYMLAAHHATCRHYGYTAEHFFIERAKLYNRAGRLQSEDEAKNVDEGVKNLLKQIGVEATPIVGDEYAVVAILGHLGVL